MAVVLLAHNGIGLGHASRFLTLASSFLAAKEKPLIIAQGYGASILLRDLGARIIPPLRMCNDLARAYYRDLILSAASLSTPSIVIEDTIPSDIDFPSHVIRWLVVRPTTPTYLDHLRSKYSNIYHRFLFADHPSSPTWTYDEVETTKINSWTELKIIGPVYRRALSQDIQEITSRYKYKSEEPICVFSMGGGGQHEGSDDATPFVAQASRIAEQILLLNKQARPLFVRGPYFPIQVKIPSIFEIVDQETNMPALFSIARAAVIRPGFNSVWECISGRTPIIPILGTNYEEQSDIRIKQLEELGLASNDLEVVWQDGDWRRRFVQIATGIAATFSGSPPQIIIDELLRQDYIDATTIFNSECESQIIRVLLVAVKRGWYR